MATTILPIGRQKRNNLGYTLIELVLTVLIIAILIGISMPLFRKQFSDLELKNSCYNIAKLVSLAQQKAISEGNFFKINFDFDKGKYWLTTSEDLKKFKRLKTKYGKVYSLPLGIEIKGKRKSFILYPNGTSDKIDLTLTGKRNKFALKSKGKLGHVEIERINTN